MSPPIISRSSTPTQSSTRFKTARDHFSPGISRPNNSKSSPRLLNLELSIEAWLDTLTSPLSTSSERTAVLNDIERTLVKITDPTTNAGGLVGLDQSTTFWALQATAGYSLAEVLLGHVYRLHLELERAQETNATSESSGSSSKQQAFAMSEVQQNRIRSTTSEICIAITILQGLTLCSRATQRITSRKASLELLLQIVLADYCTQLLPPILIPATPNSPPVTPNTTSVTDAPLPLPSGFALDLLMCILVDSGAARERFTDMGGIHQIVQLSHKCADTVTTPASTPTKGSFAEAGMVLGGRGSYVTALKQTDLLCLEFRYFWSQVLDSESGRRGSEELPTAASKPVEESTTPKASPRKRASKRDLREEGSGGAETPKAARTGRRLASPTKGVRATSEEAPSRPAVSQQAEGGGSPRKLRYSTSVAELRSKPRSSEMAPPPVPSLPATFSQDPLASRRHQARPNTSGSTSTASSQRTEQRAVRRSTVSEVNPTPSTAELGNKYAARPGMSSRDRPRIPSPLKPRTPAQEAAEAELRHRKKQEATQQAIPYRRLRSSTASTPFALPPFSSEQRMSRLERDVENQNPFLAIGMVEKRSPVETPVTPTSEEYGGALTASPSRANMGQGRAMVPPSPAVRRAQMARARSLSPTKLSLSSSAGAGLVGRELL